MEEIQSHTESRETIVAQQEMAIIQIMLDKDVEAIKIAKEKNALKEGAEAVLYSRLEELVSNSNSAMQAYEKTENLEIFLNEINSIKSELEIKNVTDTENFVSAEAGRMVLERYEDMIKESTVKDANTQSSQNEVERVALKIAA